MNEHKDIYLTHPHVVSNLNDLLSLRNIKEGILKTVGNKAVFATSDFHCMNKKYWDISQIIFFYVP